jgi:hypothetical protein
VPQHCDQVNADVVVGIAEVRIELDRGLALLDCFFQPAEGGERPAEESMSFGGRVGVDRGAELLDRALVLAAKVKDVAGAPGLEGAQPSLALVSRLRQRRRRDERQEN